MNRRELVQSLAASAIPATAQVKPRTASYAVLISEAYDRGAAVGFSLKEAIGKVRDCGSPQCFSVEICFVDGREMPVPIDDLSKPGRTVGQARAELLEIYTKNIASYRRYKAGDRAVMYLGCPPDDDDLARWESSLAKGPDKEEIERYRAHNGEQWLTDEELDIYEAEHIR